MSGTDCISRQAAIETAENVAYACDEHGSSEGWLAMLINSLEILPSAEPKQTVNNFIESLPTSPLLVGKMPSVQPEQSDTLEFWRKRADYYSDMCMNLIGEMGKGVKIKSVKISENGIEFIKEQPPAQPIDLQELEDRFGKYVRFIVNDMLTGEGKRWTR